jgi:hypothetical protein
MLRALIAASLAVAVQAGIRLAVGDGSFLVRDAGASHDLTQGSSGPPRAGRPSRSSGNSDEVDPVEMTDSISAWVDLRIRPRDAPINAR